jgi:hypothetical protein
MSGKIFRCLERLQCPFIFFVLVPDCCLFDRLGIEDVSGDACGLEHSNLGKRCQSYSSVFFFYMLKHYLQLHSS